MIRPVKDRIIIRKSEAQERSEGGIHIPETARETPAEGRVVAIASSDLPVRVGDLVIYSKYAGVEVKDGEKEYIVVREEDILGIREPS